MTGSVHEATDNVPQVQAAVGVIEKYEPGTQVTANALGVYAGMEVLLEHALPAIHGAVTGPAVGSALVSLSDVTTGIVAPLNFTTLSSTSPGQRITNSGLYVWHLQGGQFQIQGNTPLVVPLSLVVLG